MRLDLFLFKNGLAKSRTQADQMIENGILYNDKIIAKSSFSIPDDTDPQEIKILHPLIYVSRGGYKLEHALKYFNIDLQNKIVLDLGSSTGGFADCALQFGAKKVYCIDVGTSQLSKSLLDDKEHIVSMENTDARSLHISTFGFSFDVITSDLSFISQTKVYPNVYELLSNIGCFISLIKPQFELDRHALSKKGIVLDKKNHEKAISNIIKEASNHGLYLHGISKSPILGGDGNIEYVSIFKKEYNFVSQNVVQDVIYNKI